MQSIHCLLLSISLSADLNEFFTHCIVSVKAKFLQFFLPNQQIIPTLEKSVLI